MTTKEKIILKSIDEITKEIVILKDIIYSSPLSEVCNLRIEAQKLLQVNTTIEQRTSKEFINKIKVLADKEKILMKKAKKQQNSVKLIDRQIKLEIELSDLNSELFFIKRKKRLTN